MTFSKHKIMIVDETADARTEIHNRLCRTRHLCDQIDFSHEAENGDKAAEMYKYFKPEIIIMDLFMKDSDGLHGFKKIKKINPEAKIILFTQYKLGHAMESEIIKNGIKDYVILSDGNDLEQKVNCLLHELNEQ